MIFEDSARDKLAALRQIGDSNKRGRAFEDFVAEQLRRAHYQVHIDPDAAQPRQTDLVAVRENENYLIEAKALKRKATVGDVDALQSRLKRVDSAMIGVLVSLGGFSAEAIKEVVASRARPVLLLSGDEIEQSSWDPDIGSLLQRKLEVLRTQGQVLLDSQTLPVGRRRSRPTSETPLEEGRAAFLLAEGGRSNTVTCEGDFGQFVFVERLEDIDWVPASGVGVTLDMPLALAEMPRLKRVLTELGNVGWASSSGRWSIHQAETNWHGSGARDFVEELENWKARYTSAGRIHHTEEACFYDRCDGGFFTLTLDVSAGSERRIWHADLSFQLVGAPLDPTPFRRLQTVFETSAPLYFRPRNRESVATEFFPRELPDLECLGWVTYPDPIRDGADEEWASGVIVRNPFKRKRGSGRHGVPEWWPAVLDDTDTLICALRDHHPVTEPPAGYVFQRIESAKTSDAYVVCLVADWNERRRARRDRAPSVEIWPSAEKEV